MIIQSYLYLIHNVLNVYKNNINNTIKIYIYFLYILDKDNKLFYILQK